MSPVNCFSQIEQVFLAIVTSNVLQPWRRKLFAVGTRSPTSTTTVTVGKEKQTGKTKFVNPLPRHFAMMF